MLPLCYAKYGFSGGRFYGLWWFIAIFGNPGSCSIFSSPFVQIPGNQTFYYFRSSFTLQVHVFWSNILFQLTFEISEFWQVSKNDLIDSAWSSRLHLFSAEPSSAVPWAVGNNKQLEIGTIVHLMAYSVPRYPLICELLKNRSFMSSSRFLESNSNELCCCTTTKSVNCQNSCLMHTCHQTVQGSVCKLLDAPTHRSKILSISQLSYWNINFTSKWKFQGTCQV